MEYSCQILYSVCIIITFCISLPGNSILLCVLQRKQVWKTIPGIWHLQLATSDLCLTLIVPFKVDCLLHDLRCEYNIVVLIGFIFLGLSSYMLILTAMTLSHYVAVVHASCLSAPAQQKRCVLRASIVIWLVCVAASILVLVPLPLAYVQIVCIGLFTFIPFVIITFCWVHMLITIKLCGTNRHHQDLKLSLGMIVVFFVSFVPCYVTFFLDYFMVVNALEDSMYYARCIIYTLPYLHCCLNPLLHVVFGAQRFRRHLPASCSTSSQRGDESHNLNTIAAIPPNDASV